MTHTEVPARVRQLAASLPDLRPMRRGSVSERRMKCSKSGCACAQDPKARHGPYFSLTRGVGGKTRSRFLSSEQAEEARRQIAAGQEFRNRVEAYWAACEQWADAELEQAEPVSEVLEKGGSKRSSKTRSSKRSRRS